jgi:hypothetical protein
LANLSSSSNRFFSALSLSLLVFGGQVSAIPGVLSPAAAEAAQAAKPVSAATPAPAPKPAPKSGAAAVNSDEDDGSADAPIHQQVPINGALGSGAGPDSKGTDADKTVVGASPATTSLLEATGVDKSQIDEKKGVVLNASASQKRFDLHIESEFKESPFLEGSVQTIPKGTPIALTLTSTLNSELSQKGDEVFMKIAGNVPGGGEGVAIPGGWYAHGFVTKAQKSQMAHRNGYIEVEFDKLVSPNGTAETDFPVKLSTKDSAITSTLKEAAFGTKCTTVSAIGGAIFSVQLTGLSGAIATHGISVGIGAGVGGLLGIVGALRREGNAESLYSGDDVKLTVSEPIMLPSFKQEMLPSAKPIPVLKDMKISVNTIRFLKDPSGDTQSRMLDVDMTVDNHTQKSYSPSQLLVVDDRGHEFSPWLGENIKALMQKIGPEQSERIDVMYEVNSGKRKYWLSLREKSTGTELSRVPITTE